MSKMNIANQKSKKEIDDRVNDILSNVSNQILEVFYRRDRSSKNFKNPPDSKGTPPHSKETMDEVMAKNARTEANYVVPFKRDETRPPEPITSGNRQTSVQKNEPQNFFKDKKPADKPPVVDSQREKMKELLRGISNYKPTEPNPAEAPVEQKAATQSQRYQSQIPPDPIAKEGPKQAPQQATSQSNIQQKAKSPFLQSAALDKLEFDPLASEESNSKLPRPA